MKNSLVFLTAVVFPLSLYAAPIDPETLAQARCFEFDLESPQRQLDFEFQRVTGCYLRLDENQEFVFIKDAEGADKHTSLMNIKNGDKNQLLHFSLSVGESIKAKQESFVLNPLSIPHTLNKALDGEQGAREISDLSIYSDELREQLNEIYTNFFDKSTPVVEIDESFGELNPDGLLGEAFYLPESKQPADGYWWPHTGVPLANGPGSPLAKYDAYVEKQTGKNPKSYEWERANHYTNTFWAGHCNGWVASSILYGFDNKDLWDASNSITITASDLQGLRTATSYCVSNRVIGARYKGPGSDVTDVHPHKFHKNLQYFLRLMRKPVAIDYLSMMPVDNHIVSGYKMTYEPAGNNRYLVTATLKVHGYNYTYVSAKQVAKSYSLVYKYYLWKNSRGQITGGRWLNPKDHPDFMWVPLKQSRCKGENPRMDHTWVDHMVRNLPNRRTRY